MNMLFTISWRNIWRHPGRSGVLLAAIISGLWAGIVVVSWSNGLVEQRINTLIQQTLSHGQIHHPEFRREQDPSMFIQEAQPIMQWLENDPRVQAWAPRTITHGMLQSSVTTSGATIVGIDSEQERQVTSFHENIIEGRYLEEGVRNPILIGKSLAEDHNLETGQRVVLHFQDLKNDLTAASFNITGVFESASSGFDKHYVFVNSEDLSYLLADSLIYHEMALWLTGSEEAEAVITDVNDRFGRVEALTWYELSPEMRYLTDAGGYMVSIIIAIIMLALAFGILNTMLMAIFERMHELRMLLAIGMSKMRVFSMIMLESVILTLLGASAGLLLAFLTVGYLGDYGVDLTMFSEGLAEWGYDPVVYPVMTSAQYGEVVMIVVSATVLASLYPAYKAIQLEPGDVE